jgi:hypothetical protein
VMEDKNLHQDRWQRSLFLHTNRKEWFDRIWASAWGCMVNGLWIGRKGMVYYLRHSAQLSRAAPFLRLLGEPSPWVDKPFMICGKMRECDWRKWRNG